MHRIDRRIFLAAAVMLLAACANLATDDRSPVVTLNAVELRDAGLLEQVYRVKLRVQNRGGEPLAIRGVVVDIDLNDKPFAKGAGAADVVVPAYGSQLVEVEAVGGWRGIVEQFAGFTTERAPRLGYRIRGRLDTGAIGSARFDDAGEIDLPSLFESARREPFTPR